MALQQIIVRKRTEPLKQNHVQMFWKAAHPIRKPKPCRCHVTPSSAGLVPEPAWYPPDAGLVPENQNYNLFSSGLSFFYVEYKRGGNLKRSRSAKLYDTDPREMINGAIKELMRGIQIASEPINQGYRRNEKPGQRAGGC